MKVLLFVFAGMFLGYTCFSQSFTLKSNDIGGQATMKQAFNGFGIKGQNISPQLNWEHAPGDTKSFAVTIYDPTAPTGSGWWHWVVFDIPNNILELKTGAGSLSNLLTPVGAIQGKSDLGEPGYMGPAPPPGTGIHQYIITVYALKTARLGLDTTAGPALTGFYINRNAIAKASIIMYFGQ